ncbi:hypothetical protein KFL_000660340 [Klebsormidium nitens]|uniref:Uncharacterized protein n=1 Tax=Klebsormidium nitens TaxID=105231 RepID=A0A1Y1HUS9_KLENI|nr:hypothetical protein KFL_000660340 [Klebsormidium nitens]|eukprot:GAQ80939.1 hypothetical protein KFL_000660340 [Klebsormidium nitens]
MGLRKAGTSRPRLVDNVAAHANGLTHIAWSTNGKHVLTGGCDGKVTIAVAPSKDVEAKTVCSINDHEEPITALAVSPSGKHFASAAEDHIVKLYSYPDGRFDSNVTRFALPLRSLAFSATGGTLAAGGDDEGIRLISVADASISQVLKGHRGSVSSLAFDPQHTLLGSSGSDGTILVHDIEAAKVVHELREVAPKGKSEEGFGNTVGWHPDGKLMAVPGAENQILVIDRVSGEVAFSLSDIHTQAVATLAWSPNGRYLASADRDQVVLIWDMAKRDVLGRYDHVADISGLAWRPGGNDLAVADWGGNYGIWESAIPFHLPSPCGSSEAVEPEVSLRFSMHDSDEDDNSPRNSQGTSSGDPELDGDDEEAPGKETRHAPPAKKAAKPVAKEGSALAKETRDEVRIVAAAVPMQPPFQSGGTSGNTSRRHFLVYNMLGCVTSQQEEGHATVQVEFHDTSRAGSRLPALTDFFGFTMAALGDAGALLAAPKRGGKSPSALMFRPLSSWAPNAEWSVRLPESEEVLAIALGRSFIAAATSLGVLRIFSLAGVQRFVASLSGPVVSLAAHESRLAVVTHAGAPLPDGSQVLEVAQWDIGSHALCGPRGAPLRLALSPKATLTWLGFTEEGQLATYDSQGMLRVLVEEMGGCWVPFFSSASERKSASERHWVVGVGDKDLYCILCKADGPDAQPQVTPRPVLRLLPLALPLLPGDSAALEEEGVRLTLQRARAQAHPRREEEILGLETALDRNLVRQMAAACAGDNAVRALELASQLVLHKSLEGARLYASTLRMGALADRISALQQDQMDAEASRPPPAYSTTPVPSVRPPSFPGTTTPLPAEPREPQLPPVTPAFTPDLNPASKPSFTPAPSSNPDVTPAKPQEPAATKPSQQKEAPATVSKPELKISSVFGVAKEMKPSPFAKKAAPAVKESLMSSLSSAQKQQAVAAAAAAAGGLKRKGLQSSGMSNVAKAPRK